MPWLALLALLLLKQNRSVQAWWVVGLTLVSTLAINLAGAIIATPTTNDLLQIPGAIVVGLAAVWLLSPYFNHQFRLVTFLGTLAAMEASGLFAVAVQYEWDEPGGMTHCLTLVAVFGLVMSLAVHLAGWSCRGRFDWRRLSLCLGLWLLACWLVAFVVLSLCFGVGPLGEMAAALLIAASTSFGLLLPFLVLSFANGFFRTRLTDVLRLESALPAKTEA